MYQYCGYRASVRFSKEIVCNGCKHVGFEIIYFSLRISATKRLKYENQTKSKVIHWNLLLETLF